MTAAIHRAARTTTGLTDGARSILGRRLCGVLGTQNHLVPGVFLHDNEQILIETGAATRKARNVAAREHASVLVHTPDVAWVIGTGPATIAAPGEERGSTTGSAPSTSHPRGRLSLLRERPWPELATRGPP